MKKIKILKFQSGNQVKEEIIKNDYESIHSLVDGYVETLPIDNTHLIVCDEEGKIKGLNPSVYLISSRTLKVVEVIVGTCFITKIRGSDFSTLSKEDLKELSKRIQYDEEQKVSYLFV